MKPIKPRCDFDGILPDLYGLCEGLLLIYKDNNRDLYRCETHARMVQAWIESRPIKGGPIFTYLWGLSAAQMIDFRKRMQYTKLDCYEIARTVP